uniref:Uncharacterized protein n=1 Tax=viral metagenome TaxID=1070528 RepID=A0A6M3LQC2_9ZZZZ
MAYKDNEKRKLKSLEYYYRNRIKRIEYQRKWDKENKDLKKEQDKKRYKTKKYNKIQNIRHYSQIYHFGKLMEKYNGCMFCGSKERLQIHHKKYTKKISDCLLLCENCHKIIHRKPYESVLK